MHDAIETPAAETIQFDTFGPLTIAFDNRVLRPRRWTVMQASWAARLANILPTGPILELCAGAGQIGLLAAALTGRPLVQVESDEAACRFARTNARSNGLRGFVETRCSPLEAALRADEVFPLIIADLPYLPSAEVTRFPEDPLAIDGGEDGLRVIHECAGIIGRHLDPQGVCLLQLRGPRQIDAVGELLDGRSLVVDQTRVVDEDRAVALVRVAGRAGRRRVDHSEGDEVQWIAR